MSEFRIPGLQLVVDNAVFKKYVVRNPRHVLGLFVVLIYLALESYYLFYRFHGHQQDLNLYWSTAMKTLSGQVPFRDFRLEYPILALIPIVVPGLLSTLSGGSFYAYVFWFVIQNLLLGLAMGKITGKMDPTGKALSRYLIAMIFCFPLILFRFDSFPAMLTILAIAYVSRQPFFSGFSLMASIAAKLYAVVLLPVFGLFYLFSRNVRKRLLQLAGIVSFLAFILACITLFRMDAASDFTRYHLLRGIQIESLAGGVLLLLEQMGLVKLDIAHSFGAMHLTTPVAAEILWWINIITPCGFVVMTAYLAWAFYRASAMPNALSVSRLNAAAAAQILLFMLLNKVLSPQYMIWLLPLVPFCKQKTFLTYIAALMLSIVIFPGHYYYLVSKETPMVLILNIRNALLIWLFVALIMEIAPANKQSAA